jgi:hypothetical protein
MWEQTSRIVSQAAARIADNIANFLPGVVVFCAIAVAAVVLAVLTRVVTVRVLHRLSLDERADDYGLGFVGDFSASGSPTLGVGRLMFWAVLALGLLVGLTALDASMPGRFALSVFQYLPNLLAAIAIFIVGNLLARFLARAVLIGAVNMQLQAARLLSTGVKWLVLVLTVAMALEQLRIGGQILVLAFGILFAGIVLTLALAVGLGSKDVVTRSLERQIREPSDNRDKLDHV